MFSDLAVCSDAGCHKNGRCFVPKIRHIAIRAEDTATLAEFYKKAFGLKEVGRGNITNGIQAIYLSDGYINVAILPARNGQRQGIDHLGFEVENVDTAAIPAIEAGASKPEESPKDGRFAEFFLYDLVGTRVDLSEHGWKV
jgi:catechol 2,3-dioxygenase-like lactoylglutathione lyase family enzyme